MKKHKKKVKRIIIIVTILGILIEKNYIYASTASSLKQQQDNIDEKIQETNSELTDVKQEKSDALKEINNLNSEISEYENELYDLEVKINNLETEIQQKEISIVELEEKYAIQKELLDKRLVALYESGDVSYLDMLLQAESLTDFISKYYLISVIAEADEALLEKIENNRKQIESEKNSLENSKLDINNSKNELESKKSSLVSVQSKKQEIVSTLSEEEAELQKQLEEFEKDKKEIASELARLTSSNKVQTIVEPSSSGYISPINGKSKSNITTDYHGYTKISGTHTGVDFACSSGTPIVAVKAGTVVISTATKNANGTYRSYGEYIAIDHHDGTVTLYAHMLEGSRTVQVGQNVSQGQVIGKVGKTGKATGNHLHFEVRINNGKTFVDPKLYLP